ATAFEGAERTDSSALDAPVVETIGAGDAFAAGFLAGILNGLSLTGSLARAHRIATRALTSTRDHVG
uniref:PfkB family carbohydrate kinase n=1 Tax=Microbacterium sp. TaxID=51671 RepID=UPI00289CE8DD